LDDAFVFLPESQREKRSSIAPSRRPLPELRYSARRQVLPRVAGGRTVTALRWIVLMTLHMLSIATAIALATALALAG